MSKYKVCQEIYFMDI